MTKKMTVLAALLALSPRVALADKAETIHKLIQTHKDDVARDKCGRWQAASIADDPALREACAKAAWPVAEQQDSVVAWDHFQDTWEGTEWADLARVREAAAALRGVGARTPEGDLLEQAERYRGTDAEARFRELATQAAIRDAVNAAEAVGVAQRYPDAPGLWTLAERFPEGFMHVQVQGRTVDVAFDPPVPLPDGVVVTASWVARRPDGTTQPWDEAVSAYLGEHGVSAGFLDALPKVDQHQGPRFPVCYAPGQPPGWGPAVLVKAGKASLVQPVDYDKGCGTDAWPVFLSVSGDRVTSISLRPDHRVDLFQAQGDSDKKDVRAFVSAPNGTPMLRDGAVFLPAGPVWLGWPLAGGPPWVSGQAPGGAAQPLNGSLQTAGLPEGWTLAPSGGAIAVRSAKLDTMPAALRDWALAKGEIKVLAPITQRVLGLSPEAVVPSSTGAPMLGPDAGWVKNPDGSVQRLPPAGARIAGIYRMEDGDLEASLGVLAGMGISRDRIEPLDGWKSDLDGDRVPEVFLRLVIDGEGMLAIVDPIEGRSAATITNARVFLLDLPHVRSDHKVADTPFTFRKGDFVYMAWTGSEVTGATTRRRFMVVMRTQGSGFVGTGFDLD